MKLFWIHGLHFYKDKTTSRISTPNIFANLILAEYDKILKGDRTNDAEKGLHLPNSMYWFISRPDKAYSNGIFFFLVSDRDWRDREGSMSPFDSGGLWHDLIKTDPPLKDEVAIKDFFNNYNHQLNNWKSVVRTYIENNYSSFRRYIEGSPPDIGEGIKEIIKDKRNQSRAWSWEGRITKEQVKHKVQLKKSFLTSAHLIYLQNEINHSYIDTAKKIKITSWIKKNNIDCGRSPYPNAMKYLGG